MGKGTALALYTSAMAIPDDDLILPFSVEALHVRGRVAQLGPALDTILGRHEYPPAVSRVLGEAVMLTVLLATALKLEGRFVLQMQSDGPVSLVVADFTAPNELRGYARYDADAVARVAANGAVPPLPDLVGKGHLALTIDPGPTMRRYQGVVPLDGASLEEVAHAYFTQSEQIPTCIRLAVAETMVRRPDGSQHQSWRGGAISVQFLPESPDRLARRDLAPGDAPEGTVSFEVQEDDAWVEARARTETAEDHELIDPAIDPARLLLRLFHQRDVRVYDAIAIVEKCRCSRDRVETMLSQFGEDDRRSMVEDGKVVVTCEFCNTRYTLDPAEIGVGG